MNTKFANKIFRFLFIFAFLLGSMGIPGQNAKAQESTPYFFVDFAGDHVYAFQWPVGGMVTITIDDPITQDTDFTETKPVRTDNPWSSETWIDFQSTIPFSTGLVVTMTDGITTKMHTVTDLTITGASAETDTVSGTAMPGALVRVWIHDPVCCIMRHVIADVNGNWVADYSVPGDEGFETEVFDLLPNTNSQASQPDNDSDATNKPWRVPNPRILSRANDDLIGGFDWTVGSTITIEIDDPLTAPNPDKTVYATGGTAPWNPNEEWFETSVDNYDLKPGDIVTMSNGTSSKQLSNYLKTL